MIFFDTLIKDFIRNKNNIRINNIVRSPKLIPQYLKQF